MLLTRVARTIGLIRMRHGARLLALVLLGLFGWTGHAFALSPWSDFFNMPQADLATLQVKLTYVGPSDDGLPTLLGSTPTNTPGISVFVPFRRPGILYGNEDYLPIRNFTASTAELRALIVAINSYPAITAGAAHPQGQVSFALYNSVGGARVFESVLSLSQAVDLFTAFRAALTGNASALLALQDVACTLGLLEPGTPTNRAGQVTTRLAGFRFDYARHLFVSDVTVLNTTGAAISGPVTLVFTYSSPGYRLSNRTSTTCGLAPVGRDYVNVPLGGGSLLPGVPITLKLEFDDPDLLVIRPVIGVYSGAGAR